MRRRAKVDANHAEIVKALRKIGCSVLSMAPLGDDAPDLLCGYRGVDMQLEVKDGSRPPSKRRLKPGQEEYQKLWRGRPVKTIYSVEDAIREVTALHPPEPTPLPPQDQ